MSLEIRDVCVQLDLVLDDVIYKRAYLVIGI